MFRNTALKSYLKAFSKLNTTVSMIFSDINRHARKCKIGFIGDNLTPRLAN